MLVAFRFIIIIGLAMERYVVKIMVMTYFETNLLFDKSCLLSRHIKFYFNSRLLIGYDGIFYERFFNVGNKVTLD